MTNTFQNNVWDAETNRQKNRQTDRQTDRPTLTTDTATALVNALVISRIDYCNAVLAGVYGVHMQQLHGVLNAAARLIVRKRKFYSISSTIRDVLHWLPIQQRV